MTTNYPIELDELSVMKYDRFVPAAKASELHAMATSLSAYRLEPGLFLKHPLSCQRSWKAAKHLCRLALR
jgi:hypothetical protein